jgi:flavin reductase (DIM6/NTAB) family NADH-FMN oxidoreductase RutF
MSKFMMVDPDTASTASVHQHLLGLVSPRPIAFVSTVNADGQPNLAPFSFFNVYSSNPPIAVFSANRRVNGNTTKDTLANVEATGECVINMVSHSIVRQMAIASVEYSSDVNEFEKSGLTPLASDLVKPFRVAESPAQLECRVERIIALGEGPGAGHLILCRIVRIHIAEWALDAENRIDPHKIDLMARMGRAFYARASGSNVFPILQEVTKMVIGFDALPAHLRHSAHLTGNELSLIAGQTSAPTVAEVSALRESDARLADILNLPQPIEALHTYIAETLAANDTRKAAVLAWSL